MCPKMALQCQKMAQVLQSLTLNPKLDPLILKRLPNLQNNLDGSNIFTNETSLDLKSNPTTSIEIQHHMNEKSLLKVSAIQ